MTVSYELLKQKLMNTDDDAELIKMGFNQFHHMQEYMKDETYFERLYVCKNEESLEIVIIHQGLGAIDVMGFLDEFINEKKVFDAENFGHIPYLTNEDYYKQLEQELEFVEMFLQPKQENVHKIFEYEKKK